MRRDRPYRGLWNPYRSAVSLIYYRYSAKGVVMVFIERRREMTFFALLLTMILAAAGCVAGSGSDADTPRPGQSLPAENGGDEAISLKVIVDNRPCAGGLETSWGFSCLVEGEGKKVLFDTGGDGGLLLRNMALLGIDPGMIDAVVISHAHADHTGGLRALLKAHPGMLAYLCASFPNDLKQLAKDCGGALVEVTGPMTICKGIVSTGEMGTGIIEQALAVETVRGTVVITGCAHPGILTMVEAAMAVSGGEGHSPLLVLGGFHLEGKSSAEIKAIVEAFRAMGVRNAGPCHCTGEAALKAFRDAYGDAFIQVGAGFSLDLGAL
jgi:7,8-dihydropterin-6-yl-methyl-4-(beta-D-ribofuranosyl)aminobenzene 5'-phosphate synthase